MTADDAARDETLLRLRQTRAEIRQILEPPPSQSLDSAKNEAHANPRDFPRSRTMKLLVSARGMGTVGALVGGLVLARPALALKLIRMVPTGAVARMLIAKAIGALRNRS
jgi:hypothetical protein